LSKLKQISWLSAKPVRTVLTMPMPATAETKARAHDQVAAPVEAVPAKPEHKVGQLTTGELAREHSRLEAALHRPFSTDIKALLQARLDAVLDEQAERERRRVADTAAAKAELAALACSEVGG
jgi:hypothetical protein